MQNQNKFSKKTIIISIIVIIIAILAYFYMKGTPEDTTSSLESDGSTEASITVGSNVVSLLNQINSIKIDRKLFESNTYRSLIDHTVIVREQNVGKPNPFVGSFGGGISN